MPTRAHSTPTSLAVVAMCKAAVPGMQAQGWGRVVAITSLSVRQPMANLILSNTARAGVTGFLKTLALEVAASGVTVNSVQPGLHRTARVEQLYGADAVGSMAMGDADDFGAIVAFLCSAAGPLHDRRAATRRRWRVRRTPLTRPRSLGRARRGRLWPPRRTGDVER